MIKQCWRSVDKGPTRGLTSPGRQEAEEEEIVTKQQARAIKFAGHVQHRGIPGKLWDQVRNAYTWQQGFDHKTADWQENMAANGTTKLVRGSDMARPWGPKVPGDLGPPSIEDMEAHARLKREEGDEPGYERVMYHAKLAAAANFYRNNYEYINGRSPGCTKTGEELRDEAKANFCKIVFQKEFPEWDDLSDYVKSIYTFRKATKEAHQTSEAFARQYADAHQGEYDVEQPEVPSSSTGTDPQPAAKRQGPTPKHSSTTSATDFSAPTVGGPARSDAKGKSKGKVTSSPYTDFRLRQALGQPTPKSEGKGGSHSAHPYSAWSAEDRE